MANILELYYGVEIDNSYQDIFINQSNLLHYLASKTVTNFQGDFYLTDKGRLTIPVNGQFFEGIPNYMVYTQGNNATICYFIKEFRYLNNVVEIEYIMDVWHTFVDEITRITGKHIVSSYPIGGRGEIPVKPVITNGGTTYIENTLTSSKYCTILAIGYAYTAVSADSGIPSNAIPFMIAGWYYGTSSTGTALSYAQAPEVLSLLYTGMTSLYTSFAGDTYYYNITNSWIVPATFLSGDTIGGETFYSLLDYTTTRITGMASVIFDDIQFTFIQPTNEIRIQESPNYSIYGQPTWDNKIILSYGIDGLCIPREWAVYDYHSKRLEFTSCTQSFGVDLSININGTQYSIMDNYATDINFVPESALVAEQRRINMKMEQQQIWQSFTTGMISSISTNPVNMVTSMVSSFVDLTFNLAENNYKNSKNINTTITASEVGNNALSARIGMQMCAVDVENMNEIINSYYLYGLNVNYIDSGTPDVVLDDHNKTNLTYAEPSYNVVAYENPTIIGNIPSQYREVIRYILSAGTRIWLKTNATTLDPLSSENAQPSALTSKGNS